MSEFTRILQLAEEGNSNAAAELLPIVYDELRRLAAAKMAREPADQTLQPTALVHEADRLGGGDLPVPIYRGIDLPLRGPARFGDASGLSWETTDSSTAFPKGMAAKVFLCLQDSRVRQHRMRQSD